MEIIVLRINTKNLLKQVEFYSDIIGLPLLEKSEKEAVFQVGKSKLSIVQSDNFQPYHFAINIPCNKEAEALTWLKKRVQVLKDGEDEMLDFASWNAKAIYFYDHDKNIVEFIARKNLKNKSEVDFDVSLLLELSEIGMPVSNIESAFNALKKIVNLHIYDGGFERFCAIGDEKGLFICINKKIKNWFPVGDKAYSAAFEIHFKHNDQEYAIAFNNEAIKAI